LLCIAWREFREKASAYLNKGLKCYSLEGGIINYAKQIKRRNLESKFIGKTLYLITAWRKNTDDIVSKCHQCGKPCDVHTNCINEGCHLFFINVKNVQAMQGCCSQDCVDVIHLPEEEQKRSVVSENGNKIFKKENQMY
jgi:UPF0176 protein